MGHLAIPGDSIDCHSLESVGAWFGPAVQWVEARDDAKHPTGHRAAPPQRMWSKMSVPTVRNSVFCLFHDNA